MKITLKIIFILFALSSTAFAKGTVFEKDQESYLISVDGYLTLVTQFALVYAFEKRCKIELADSVDTEFNNFIDITPVVSFESDVIYQRDVILESMKNNLYFCERWKPRHIGKGLLK